jgi:hypothetical protein
MKPQFTTVYRCEYHSEISGMLGPMCVRSSGGLEDFKDGFWITAQGRFTKGSDSHYWIPPSTIKYIAKDRVPI